MPLLLPRVAAAHHAIIAILAAAIVTFTAAIILLPLHAVFRLYIHITPLVCCRQQHAYYFHHCHHVHIVYHYHYDAT